MRFDTGNRGSPRFKVININFDKLWSVTVFTYLLMELKWKESNFICALRSGQSSADHKFGLKCKYTLHSDRLIIQTIRKLSKTRRIFI